MFTGRKENLFQCGSACWPKGFPLHSEDKELAWNRLFIINRLALGFGNHFIAGQKSILTFIAMFTGHL